MAAVLKLWLDLALVKVENSLKFYDTKNRSQGRKGRETPPEDFIGLK